MLSKTTTLFHAQTLEELRRRSSGDFCYAAYKQMIPDRGYRFEWFINETEVEKIETENEQMIHNLKILPQYFED